MMKRLVLFLSHTTMMLAQDVGNIMLRPSQDWGCYGETFPIQEMSLLDIIQCKLTTLLQEGKMKDHQKNIQNQIISRVKQPQALKNIRHTTRPRTFTFDPTFVLDHDMTDAQGRILHPKGTRINPLKHLSLSRPLLFIDGDVHGRWANEQLKQHSNAKIILVKGSPFDLSEKIQHPVYFDQGGVLCAKLGITQAPARITQVNDHLLIEEVLLTEIHLEEVLLTEVRP